MITGMSKDGKPSEDSCGVEVNTIKALEAKVKASGDDDAMELMALLREDLEVCLKSSPATSCLVLLRHSL